MNSNSKVKGAGVSHKPYCGNVARFVPPSDIIPYLAPLRLWVVYDCVNHQIVSVGESYSQQSRLCLGHSWFCLVRFDSSVSHLPR